jgi:hypothetical protein
MGCRLWNTSGQQQFLLFFLFLGQHRQKKTANKVCTLKFQRLPSIQYNMRGYPLDVYSAPLRPLKVFPSQIYFSSHSTNQPSCRVHLILWPPPPPKAPYIVQMSPLHTPTFFTILPPCNTFSIKQS